MKEEGGKERWRDRDRAKERVSMVGWEGGRKGEGVRRAKGNNAVFVCNAHRAESSGTLQGCVEGSKVAESKGS